MKSTIIFVSIFLIVIPGISAIHFVNVNAQGEGEAYQTLQFPENNDDNEW